MIRATVDYGTSNSGGIGTNKRFMVSSVWYDGRWREMRQSDRKLQHFRAKVHWWQKDLYGNDKWQQRFKRLLIIHRARTCFNRCLIFCFGRVLLKQTERSKRLLARSDISYRERESERRPFKIEPQFHFVRNAILVFGNVRYSRLIQFHNNRVLYWNCFCFCCRNIYVHGVHIWENIQMQFFICSSYLLIINDDIGYGIIVQFAHTR